MRRRFARLLRRAFARVAHDPIRAWRYHRATRTFACSCVVRKAVTRMRVSAEQKAAMLAAAAREGLELSQWLRQLALRAAGLLSPKV
jgi:hypothetical protein